MVAPMTAPEVNLVDPDTYQRGGPPHDQFAWLREHAPVFWHADGGEPGWPGFWAVTSHHDIEHVSRHPEVFSSTERLALFGVREPRIHAADDRPP
jgi:cholest-4-en-3-one 26-monooxygenase